MIQSKPASFKIFIAVISIVVSVAIAATLFTYYGVDRKYSMFLALFLFIAFTLTAVGIYAGARFSAANDKLRRLNLVGQIGNTVILLFTLGIMGYAAFGKANETQPADVISKPLCRKWKPVAIEDEGKMRPIPEHFQHTRMNFLANHIIESTDGEKIAIGNWQYDENSKTITIVDQNTRETVMIEVKSITEKDLVVQLGTPQEKVIIPYMKPDGR